ncbi:hypothetical protein Bhyg_11630 [Pseudolycoriella hygida]|uniref:Uncharacterized protein n=1 Tax=Pseudolycoriella hygida TaxID=35572 RepID=A0A9Q0MYC9_9DIPT|nr:hypothetical protein Bhyg_11630 [Pseudolycoriella hygida]
MNKNLIVLFVAFVAVISGDEKPNKYTQVIQPPTRQLPPSHDGYQSDGIYPAQTSPYQAAYQPANEGIYQPAIEEVSVDNQAHQHEQPLENPAYDPNMYQNFVPQDSVQQYVNSYGGPYAPGAHAVGYPIPYGAGYGPGGFALQTGFLDIFRNTLPYPRTIMSMLMRSGTYLLSSIGVILFGGAVTTAICTLTPLCTITFAALPFLGLRETLTSKTIKESIANEITSDRVRRAAEFVRTALEKYNQIQEDFDTETKNDATSTVDDKKHNIRRAAD